MGCQLRIQDLIALQGDGGGLTAEAVALEGACCVSCHSVKRCSVCADSIAPVKAPPAAVCALLGEGDTKTSMNTGKVTCPTHRTGGSGLEVTPRLEQCSQISHLLLLQTLLNWFLLHVNNLTVFNSQLRFVLSFVVFLQPKQLFLQQLDFVSKLFLP